jgi:hypothetical protein
MKNPWTKKNPFMSLWLSGANSLLGRARGPAASTAAQQRASLTRQATRFWTGAWLAATKPKRHR